MESARTGLRQIVSDLLRSRPPEEAVMLAWPLVCGKEVAARSNPLTFGEGTLLVEVPDATWRSQLQSFAPRYLAEYQNLLGPMVRRVEFKLKQLSAISGQRSAEKQLSALSDPPSAKPARSASNDTSVSTSKPRVPFKKTRKKR
jgi:Dna[CI] antecedent DciA-like protein